MEVDEETVVAINAIAARFGVREPRGVIPGRYPAFDLSNPVFHSSKTEFLTEKSGVDNAIEHIDGIFHALVGRDGQSAPYRTELRAWLDADARQLRTHEPVGSVLELVSGIIADAGQTYATLGALIGLGRSLEHRKQELERQEREYWNVRGRPPNHHARAIALRFAKVVARATRKRPTYGTARDGGHPSTEFSRALEEIYRLLEIEADVKNNAKWAVMQLTDDDLNPPPRSGLFGFDIDELREPDNHHRTGTEEIVEKLSRGTKKDRI